ncbi:MAG: PolC-type DNA polymerase III [Peptococcia bacterium]|jgi:DNA polymerase-3 subunit alpha (Gram-positive type)
MKAKWKKLLDKSSFSSEVREFINSCEIKKILISQAEKAWEIYFCSPQEPSTEIKETLQNFWENTFGQSYKIVFHFENSNSKIYSNLKVLCAEKWEEIIGKLSTKIPSSKGWLEGAKYQVEKNTLQIVLKQKLGCAYLVKRGAQLLLQDLLRDEYNYEAKVEITSDETVEKENHWADLEELANLYQERFQYHQNKQENMAAKPQTRMIMGKSFKKEIVALNQILDEEREITIKGLLFNLEKRELKSGRILLSFFLTDKTDSLACKLIINPKEQTVSWEQIQENKWYLVNGRVEHDRYTQELTMFPRDMMETEPQEREDNAERKRVELHLHTKMSALDSVADVKDVVNKAHSWGHSAIAITDHGVVQAFPDAYAAAKGKGIKIIYGVEGYLFDDSVTNDGGKAPTYHVIILARNQQGLANLYRLVTISHLQHFYRVPRIPKSELIRLREGLLVGSACEAGEVFRALLNGASQDKLKEIANFYDYLEIQPLGNNRFMLENGTFTSEDDLIRLNKIIYDLGKDLNKAVVATCDVHFLEPEDEVFRRILMTGKGFEDADKQAPLYFRTTEEMLQEFAYLGNKEAEEVVIANPLKIASLIGELKPIPDELYPPNIPGADEEIIRLTKERAEELYGPSPPELIEQRIAKELNSIINNGFAVLYWIAHKLVKKSNEDGYLVGSRGSVGSSFVAYLCGITEVNPLPPHYRCPTCKEVNFADKDSIQGSGADLIDKNCPLCGIKLIKDGHNIPFEVFLGFKGDKVPDIDLNFSGDYQPRAHKYTEKLFGKDNVFRAGTIATVASKTAYGFVKNYFEEKNQYKRQAELTRLINGCTGVKRTTGQHPGGIMVLPKGLDIHLFTPLQRPADDVRSEIITTHFDYHSISSRLVKLDILGHDDPTIIKMLEDWTGVDSRKIPLDEPKVLSLFTGIEALGIKQEDFDVNVGTLGIPEFGTKFVRQMLEDTKPQTFSDLVRISGFSHGTDVWLNNAQTLIKSGTAKINEVISARDDIMNYLLHKGLEPGMAFKIMEDVRKGKGVKADYVQAMKENGVPDWYIDSCQKIKYMFPKAHAVAYVMMAFRIAYFKVYYPAAFYASYFTVHAHEVDADLLVSGISGIKAKMKEIKEKGNDTSAKEEKMYSLLEVALEMYLRDLRFERVNLQRSDAVKFLIEGQNNSLLCPFISIEGLGKTAALNIIRMRKKKAFSSQEDLRNRCKLSKTILEMLEQHGALEGLPENDQLSLFL